MPKVTKKGAGSAALKDLCIMEDITAAVIEAVPQIPITEKVGWDSENIVYVLLELIKAKFTVEHLLNYIKENNWDYIKSEKSVNIPVIGRFIIGYTKCEVMIGRGAIGYF